MAKWSIPDLLNIPANLLDLPLLERVYIPNLVPSLFTFNKAHAKLINNCTSSPRLLKVLHKWNKEHKFKCFIEVGPSPTLTDMAICTLKTKYKAEIRLLKPQILSLLQWLLPQS